MSATLEAEVFEQAAYVHAEKSTISGRILKALHQCTATPGDYGRWRLDGIRADGHTLTAADGCRVVQVATPCNWGEPAIYPLPKSLCVGACVIERTAAGVILSQGQAATAVDATSNSQYPDADSLFWTPDECDIQIRFNPLVLAETLAALASMPQPDRDADPCVTMTIRRENAHKRPIMFRLDNAKADYAARALVSPIVHSDDL